MMSNVCEYRKKSKGNILVIVVLQIRRSFLRILNALFFIVNLSKHTLQNADETLSIILLRSYLKEVFIALLDQCI